MDEVLTFKVMGDDPDDTSPLTYEWILKGIGLQTTTLHTSTVNDGAQETFQFVPEHHMYVPCGGRSIELEVKVTDGDNMVGTRTISITVGRPC